MSNSTQSRISRLRAPRVHITYDVEDGGAATNRELPMVAAVITDLSGDGSDPEDYAKRQFVEVEPGGLDALMRRIAPEVNVTVPDRLADESENKEISAALTFNSLDDFSPMGVATQLAQTRSLLETRRRLADLYGKIESNEGLDTILGDILADSEKQDQLRRELSEDSPDNA